MNYNPTTDEIELAQAREIVSTSVCRVGADQTTFEVLHALSIKTAHVRQSAVFTTDIYEFMDGIFGVAVILCGGVGCYVSTKNNTKGFWKVDKSSLEILIFELIRTACTSTKNLLLTSRTNFDSLIVTASLDTPEYDIELIEQLAVKLGGRAQIIFHYNLKTLALHLPIKKGNKKDLVASKESFDYLCDPYSSAYIGLFDVCENPLLMSDEEW